MALCGLLGAALGPWAAAQSTYISPIDSPEALATLLPSPELLVRARLGDAGDTAFDGPSELTLGSALQPKLASAHMAWQAGATETFRLTFDGFGAATLLIGGQTLIAPSSSALEALAVTARAPAGGARARIFDLTLNGSALPKGANAWSPSGPKAFDGTLVRGASLRSGFVLTGSIKLDWPGALPGPHTLAVELHAGRLAPQMQRFCSSTANSTGLPCRIDWWGTTSISSNKFRLTASNGPPSAVCLYLVGATTQSLPYGNGTLCVGAPMERLADFLSFDGQGRVELAVDLQQGPLGDGPLGVLPGDTRSLQVWYRDPAGGSEDLNLSDALLATFLP